MCIGLRRDLNAYVFLAVERNFVCSTCCMHFKLHVLCDPNNVDSVHELTCISRFSYIDGVLIIATSSFLYTL